MKKSIFNVLLSTALWILLFTFPFFIRLDNNVMVKEEKQELTMTDYYRHDLYAQCRGLDYFNIMISENESLKINKNFYKEYQKTIAYIERDKNELKLSYFKCP
jgi:hypothetical protein